MQEKTSYELLPTGKSHISFSEVKCWKECSYRHNLIHVKKLGSFTQSIPLVFGTAIHSAAENFLKTRVMDANICHDSLREAWKKSAGIKEFTDKELAAAVKVSSEILSELPGFLDTEFPGWQFIAAEHQLYESIDGQPHAFKGFIDGIISAKGKRGEDLHWILDWKSSNTGWRKDKRSDETLKYQLALYKNFWMKKNPDLSIKNVRCAFVILNKSAKPGKHCELFTVSLGEVPIKRSLKVVSNMLASVKKGICLKNRDSCKYCEFKDTEHCT